MTPDKYSALKVLGAIVLAIVVGFITHSWVWGVVSFLIAIFFLVWIADWIFGGPIKDKVTVDDKQRTLLEKLEMIGDIKRELPLSERGWCNSLGLYVQLREMAGMARLEAGDKRHTQVDAWRDYSTSESPYEWKAKKYHPGDWETLVDPTLEIALFLDSRRFKGGISTEDHEALKTAISVFQKEGSFDLLP